MLFRRAISDKTLVERVLRGQRDEFALLVDRYLPMVQALAFAQLGNAAELEDVTQEAFLKAYASLDSLRNRAAFRPWLAAIARNAAVSIVRARRPTSTLDPNLPANDNPQRDAERHELREMLGREIIHLPHEYREVLLLHYFSGLKIREVAETIGASPEATAKRIQRAREALGQRLVRELGLVSSAYPDRLKARTKIMAAIAAAPVAWEAGAVAGGGGIGLVAKLAAGGVVALLIATAALLLPNPPGSETSIAIPEPVVAASEDTEVAAVADAKANDMAPEVSSSTAVPDFPEIPADGPGIIRGRVIYPDGTPAPGAEVVLAQNQSVRAPSGRLMPRRRTVADDSGNFTFDTVPIGTEFNEAERYNVFSEKGKFIGVAPVYLPESAPCAFAWLELVPVGKKSGRVVNESGEGIAGAIVYVPFGFGIDTKTDSDGAFSVPFALEGELWVLATAPGYMWNRTDPIAAGTEPAVIEMRRGCTIAGTAVDAESLEPLGGNEVKATCVEPYVRFTTTTNADGAFVFSDLSTGAFTFSVSGTHYIEDDALTVVLSEAGETKQLDLQLHLGATITGRVYRHPSGEPVADHSIFRGPRGIMIRSSADGTFRFEGLRPGEYTVSDMQGAGDEQKVVVDSIQEYEVAIELAEGNLSVDGIVVDPAGEPVTGARVEIAQDGASTVTGADGRFTIARLPYHGGGHFDMERGTSLDRARIQVTKEGIVGISKDIGSVVGSQSTGPMRLVVSPPAWMTGRLADERGQPVLGARVAWSLVSEFGSHEESRTTFGGRFAAANLAPGEYRMSVKREGLAEVFVQTVQVPPGEFVEDVVLTLAPPPAGEITGRVLDTAGVAIPGVSVGVEGPNRVTASSHTVNDGSYSLHGLPDGIYQVAASGDEYATISRQVVVPTAEPADFVLPKKGAISGHVYDAATGMLLNEFDLQYEPGDYSETKLPSHHVNDPGDARYRPQVVDDEEGSFTILNLRDGPHTVAARADGYRMAYTVVEVPEGAHVDGVELFLEARARDTRRIAPPAQTSLEGVVVDTAGRPLAGAGVFVDRFSLGPPGSGPRYSARCDDEGRFRVDSVLVGTTHVLATHEGFAPGAATVSLKPGAPGRVQVVLSSGGTVAGAVHFDGRPVAEALVFAESRVMDNAVVATATTGKDGTYVIADVALGEVVVRVEMPIAPLRTRNYEHVGRVDVGRTSNLSFELSGGPAVVEGRVVPNPDSKSRRILVVIPLADGSEEVSEIETSPNGEFTIPMLPEAPIVLRVRVDEETEKEIQVTPTAGEPTYVEIDLAE